MLHLGLVLCVFVVPLWAARPPFSAERIKPEAKPSFVRVLKDIQVSQSSPEHEVFPVGDYFFPSPLISHQFRYIDTNSPSQWVRFLGFPLFSRRHQSFMNKSDLWVLRGHWQVLGGSGIVVFCGESEQPGGRNTYLISELSPRSRYSRQQADCFLVGRSLTRLDSAPET